MLEGLSWRLHRIWSTDWFRNPRAKIKVLKEAIDASLADAKARGVMHSERLNATALLARLAEDNTSDVEEVPAQSRTKTRPETAAPIATAATPKPEQANLAFEPSTGSDLFTAANRVAAEPTVALGPKVKVEHITDGKKLAFTLVEGENAPEQGKIVVHTPLGQALLDAQVGDEVEYQVGSQIKEVRVLEIGL